MEGERQARVILDGRGVRECRWESTRESSQSQWSQRSSNRTDQRASVTFGVPTLLI
jgi:hypothetical protein